jgi:ribosomal protein S5
MHSWTLLGVVASDILKADRTLGMVRGGRTLRSSVCEYVGQIIGYLTVALERAEEFKESATDQGFAMPSLFNVMLRDIKEALQWVERLPLDDVAFRSTSTCADLLE